MYILQGLVLLIEIGKVVYDYALGMNGIVVGEAFAEPCGGDQMRLITWEWRVLYEDGKLSGADTGDLKAVR